MSDLVITKESTEEQVAVDPNALGQSEHDQAMIAAIDNQGAEASAESSIDEQAAQEAEEQARPEWLPEKFKSVEDLAKAYAELESKLGQPKEEAAEEAKAEEVVETQELDTAAYMEEFMANGDLGEESRSELNKRGIPNDMIDGYLQSLKHQQEVSVTDFYNAVGGQEVFESVSKWAASGNGDQNVLAAYNSAIERGDTVTAQALFGTLSTSYQNENGTFGRRVSGNATPTSSDSFRSMAEMMEAMRDKRYMGSETQRDPAFIREVEAKIARSKF